MSPSDAIDGAKVLVLDLDRLSKFDRFDNSSGVGSGGVGPACSVWIVL